MPNQPRISRKISQTGLSGVEEFIGQASLTALIKRSQVALLAGGNILPESSPGIQYAEITVLQQALEDIYGAQGARGVAMRSGRAALCYFLKEFGEECGFNQLDFRLLPARKRILTGLEQIAAVIGREISQPIQVQSGENAWIWQIDLCPECWGRQNSTAMCYFTIGLLQEFLSWMSGGRIYLVEETACRAKGDPACIIRINKKPLD